MKTTTFHRKSTRVKLTRLQLLGERLRLKEWIESHDPSENRYTTVKLRLMQIEEELQDR